MVEFYLESGTLFAVPAVMIHEVFSCFNLNAPYQSIASRFFGVFGVRVPCPTRIPFHVLGVVTGISSCYPTTTTTIAQRASKQGYSETSQANELLYDIAKS